MENLDLKLDPLNPPKYCPQCARNGIKSKVKKFKVNPNSTDLVIMCKNDKCPWPFSVAAPEDVTVKEDSKSSNTGKKRKKDKTRLSDTGDPNPPSDSTENKEVIDKCKSPHNKKLRLAPDKAEEQAITASEAAATLAPDIELGEKLDESLDTKQKRRASKEQDVINYLDKNCDIEKDKFNMDDLDFEPDESSNTEENSENTDNTQTTNENEPDVQESKSTNISTSNETSNAVKASTSTSESDSLLFTAVPVAVRQPLKLPRHASNILSSRHVESEVTEESDDDADLESTNIDSDLECFVSDESDSELESLASECSTMSAVSENSSVGTGEESEGAGKKKRRGKKKKRKNRRKAHEGKCSKEQHRVSDLAMLSNPSVDKANARRSRSSSREKSEAISGNIQGDVVKEVGIHVTDPNGKTILNVTNQNPKPNQLPILSCPMVTLQNTILQEVMSSDENTPPQSVAPPLPMVVTPAVDKSDQQTVVRMSVTPGKTPASAMSVESISSDIGATKTTPPAMSISPEDPLSPPAPPSPQVSDCDSDLEMSDLSNFQMKWGELTPLSPMSVTETEVDLDHKDKKTPIRPGKKIHIPYPGPAIERKGLKVLLPNSGMSPENNFGIQKQTSKIAAKTTSDLELAVDKTSSSADNKGQKPTTASTLKGENECAVFKPPPNPKPSPARPISHPSPGYSSFPSPNYSSQKYLSLPNLLSPMPATPKSHHDDEDKTHENDTNNQNLSLEVSRDNSCDLPDNEVNKESATGQKKLEAISLDLLNKSERSKVPEVEVDKSAAGKSSAKTPETIKKQQGLPDGPYPRRRGRKSTAKKFVSDEDLDSSTVKKNNSGDSQSKSPSTMKPPETPPKRGRGRPPKIKTPEKPITSPSAGNISPIVKPKSTTASPTNIQVSPNKNKLAPVKVIKLVSGKSLPPGLVPCAPPPGSKLIPCAPPNRLSSKSPKKSLFDIEETDIDILQKVQKAIKIQNENKAEKDEAEASSSQSKVDNAQSTSDKSSVSENQEEESQLVKPEKTFQRKPKKPQGTSMPGLSNKLYLNTGLDIEAVILPHESSIDLPTLSLASFYSEDPDFALVRKLGSGISLDTELGSLDSEEALMETALSQTESKSDNSVVFHVANQAMINQPTGVDNLEVKEQGDTRVLLTASSNQIEVHDLKKTQLRYNQPQSGRGRGRGRGRGKTTGERMMMRQNSANNKEQPLAFGNGWFMWRDWKVDQEFIVGFSEYIGNLVKKHNLPQHSKIDPRIEALLKEKESSTENPATVQKVITFFAEVYVKYLYIRQNFGVLTVEKVINILRENYTLDNAQFSVQIRRLMQQMQEQGTQVVNRGTQASPPPRGIADHEYGQQPPPPQARPVYQQHQPIQQSQHQPIQPAQITPQQSIPQLRSAPAGPLDPVSTRATCLQPIPLSESVKAKMIKTALENNQSEGLASRIAQMHQHSQSLSNNMAPGQTLSLNEPPTAHSHPPAQQPPLPPSPSQPINLSTSAAETSLPPSPTDTATTYEHLPSTSATVQEQDDYPNHPSVISINPPSVEGSVRNLNSVNPHVSEITIKTEPDGEEPPATPMGPPRHLPVPNIGSVAPSSCMVSSVYNDGGCSVQLASVCPATPGEVVGQGPKVLQFFYQNPVDDIKIGFPPVRVTTDEEVNCVVALVTEKAEEYNRRNNLAHKGKQVQYYSSAMQARSILDQDIVRHIEKCFTKKGMKESKTGRKKRAYPKRKDIIKVPSDYFKVKQEQVENVPDEYEDFEEEEEEEEEEVVDDVQEYVPTELEMKSTLEEKIFGGQMPVSVRKSKPPRKGVSDRIGRGGRNENVKKNAPETLVLGAVEYMLGNQISEDGENQATINLSSLFKKRGRKKKKRMDIDAFSDEDDYKAPNSKMEYRTGAEGHRKSRRIIMKYEIDDQEDSATVNTNTHIDESSRENVKLNEAGSSNESIAAETLNEELNEDKNKDREKKLQQVENILISTISVSKSTNSSKDPEHNFTEPESSSEDEQNRKGKWKRGQQVKGMNNPATHEAVHSQVEEMIRCASRNSRPGSQASSRPGSQMSRPGSTLPKKVAKQLEHLGSPERDSPVLAPRLRHKEAKEKEKLTPSHSNLTSRKSTPVPPKSPINSTLVNENYLRKEETSAISSNGLPGNLGNFDQAFTRKKQSEKIKKLLEKQKKKAEKLSSKKYKGFGETVNPEEESIKKKEEKEQKKKDSIIKKAQVSKSEVDLMKELLKIGETAVAEAKSNPLEKKDNVKEKTSKVSNKNIQEFEEFQTIDDSCPSSQNLSEELDSLFELK